MRTTQPEEFSRLLAEATGRLLEPGHSVEIINNGAIFRAMEEVIRSAERHVHIVMYIWKPGEASDRVIAAIAHRRKAGVPVRIVVDRLGSRGGFTDEVLPKLEALGCEVKLFHHPVKVSPRKTLARNHRKIVIADGRVAIAGGWCVWDEFLGDGREEHQWRDTNVRLHGPGVRFMQEAFLRNWREAGGELPPLAELPWPEPDPSGVPSAFVHSSGASATVPSARELVRTVIPFARRRLWISCAYFSPDDEQIALLTERARAGVDVRILVPGPIHDVPPLREAGRGSYPRLLKHGVRLWEYQASMMHAKTFVVDEALCVVGSINLEPVSLNVLEEGSAIFWSPLHAEQLARDFVVDLSLAREITEQTVPAPQARPVRGLIREAGAAFASWARRLRRGGAREISAGV